MKKPIDLSKKPHGRVMKKAREEPESPTGSASTIEQVAFVDGKRRDAAHRAKFNNTHKAILAIIKGALEQGITDQDELYKVYVEEGFPFRRKKKKKGWPHPVTKGTFRTHHERGWSEE